MVIIFPAATEIIMHLDDLIHSVNEKCLKIARNRSLTDLANAPTVLCYIPARTAHKMQLLSVF